VFPRIQRGFSHNLVPLKGTVTAVRQRGFQMSVIVACFAHQYRLGLGIRVRLGLGLRL
jgi:hypothetical protein